MAMVSIKCPNCAGALELDGSKEFGFCMFCGSQVHIQEDKTKVEVSGQVKFDESEKYNNFLNLANQAYAVGNMEEAYNYFTRALEIKQSDYLPVFRKGLCAGYLSGDTGFRIEEVVSGISRAYDLAPDPAVRKTMSEEIVIFALTHKLLVNREFYSSDDCARYVRTVHNKVSLLNRLYLFVDKDNAERAVNFINVTLSYCGWLNATALRFKAGTVIKDGQSQAVFGTYPVPQNVTHDIADIRARFVQEFNKYLIPQIGMKESQIAGTKQKIKEMPSSLRGFRAVSSIWVFLLGLVTAPLIIGMLIWIAQLVCFILYKVQDKDKQLSNLYKSLKKQKKELAMLKRQIKK